MADPRPQPTPTDREIVRTRRAEVLDSSDRVRVVIGEQKGAGPHDVPVFGIALVGPDGHGRAELIEDAAGARLAFLASGNIVVELGADDVRTLVEDRGGNDLEYVPAGTGDSEVVRPGPYLVFCDRDGAALCEHRGSWDRTRLSGS